MMRLGTVVITGILLAFLFLAGCQSNEGKDEQAYEKNELPNASMEEGFSLGLYENDEIISKRTFILNQEEDSFTKELVFGNKTSKEEEFALVVFNHHTQLPFTINDESEQVNFYKFKVNANEYKKLKVELTEIEDGFHSINYLIFRSPEREFQNLQEALAYNQVYTVKVNLLKQLTVIPNQAEQFNDQAENGDSRAGGIFISDVEDAYNTIFSVERDNISHSVVYGNKDSEGFDYYLVRLLNWEQIPVSDGQLYLYGHLESGSDKIISNEIDSSLLAEEKNTLIYLLLPNPYEELPDNNPYPLYHPYSSNRLVIK